MTHRADRRPLASRPGAAVGAAALGIALATTAPGALASAAPTHRAAPAHRAAAHRAAHGHPTRIDAAFVKKIDGSCARLSKAIAANGSFPFANFDPLHPKRSQLPKVGAFFEKDVPAARAFGASLAAAGMPSRGAATWREVRGLALRYNAAAIDQATAATRADVTAFVTSVRALTSTGAALTAIAAPAGFSRTSACGQIF